MARPAFVANNEVALHVADIAAAESFYVRVLGCAVVSRTDECIALRNGALRLYLLRDPAPAHEAVVPSFDVPSRADALRALQAEGCTLVPVGPHAPGEHYLRDPFGVLFDVIERPLSQARWYARPVLFVSDVHRASRFYIEQLGFTRHWHTDNGAGSVCQVDRGECEIILCADDTRQDRGRLFIELTADALADLRRELAERGVPTRETWWGYDTLQVDDPDGNQLFFPTPV
jgi:catechol 2,3-dioxygenase-like lactoylglutathione lyase family enzyme